jgi:hypothetical protein
MARAQVFEAQAVSQPQGSGRNAKDLARSSAWRSADIDPGAADRRGAGLDERFARGMQDRQKCAGALLRAALGKARGQALRLVLVLELLWWCGEDGAAPPPTRISPRAFATAADLMGNYFMAMAERVDGDIPATMRDRNAATLARWIFGTRPRGGPHSSSAAGGSLTRLAHSDADSRRVGDTRRYRLAVSAGAEHAVRTADAAFLSRQSPALAGDSMSRLDIAFPRQAGNAETPSKGDRGSAAPRCPNLSAVSPEPYNDARWSALAIGRSMPRLIRRRRSTFARC